MYKKENRIKWIDISKGIGIILVVLGHCNIPMNWAIIIYSFHMPLFFFLSGYLFSIKKYSSFNPFLVHKAKTILLPYFYFSFLSFLYFAIHNQTEIIKPLIGIFYSNGINGWMPFNVALWFLTCLFMVEMASYFIVKNTVTKMIVILVILSIIGYIDSLFMPFRLPWGIDVAFTATVFFCFGYIIRKIDAVKILLRHKFSYLLASLITLSIFVRTMIDNQYMVDMNYNKLNHFFDFYIPAICGIIIVIMISNFITSNLLSYIGENTLFVLVAHVPILLTIEWGFNHYYILNSHLVLRSIAVMCLTFILLLSILPLVNRYLPFLLGKKLLISKVD